MEIPLSPAVTNFILLCYKNLIWSMFGLWAALLVFMVVSHTIISYKINVLKKLFEKMICR